MNRRLLVVLIALAAGLAFAGVARAQGGTSGYPTADDVNRVAKNLYCPVCPNTPLDVCETKACEDWRAQIRDELKAGWSEQQVVDYFVAQYGERVLAEPRRGGFTSLAWLLPVIGVLLGLILVWQVLKNWQGGRAAQPGHAPPPRVSPEVLARIEEELREIS